MHSRYKPLETNPTKDRLCSRRVTGSLVIGENAHVLERIGPRRNSRWQRSSYPWSTNAGSVGGPHSVLEYRSPASHERSRMASRLAEVVGRWATLRYLHEDRCADPQQQCQATRNRSHEDGTAGGGRRRGQHLG